MGGFLNGMNGQFQQNQQDAQQKQFMDLFERMNQGGFGRKDPQMQGPMPSIQGISLMNRMMSGMRGGMQKLGGMF